MPITFFYYTPHWTKNKSFHLRFHLFSPSLSQRKKELSPVLVWYDRQPLLYCTPLRSCTEHRKNTGPPVTVAILPLPFQYGKAQTFLHEPGAHLGDFVSAVQTQYHRLQAAYPSSLDIFARKRRTNAECIFSLIFNYKLILTGLYSFVNIR